MIRDVGRGVAWDGDDLNLVVPDAEASAVLKQTVELGPVSGHVEAEVEDLPELLLHLDNARAYTDPSADAGTQVGRG